MSFLFVWFVLVKRIKTMLTLKINQTDPRHALSVVLGEDFFGLDAQLDFQTSLGSLCQSQCTHSRKGRIW